MKKILTYVLVLIVGILIAFEMCSLYDEDEEDEEEIGLSCDIEIKNAQEHDSYPLVAEIYDVFERGQTIQNGEASMYISKDAIEVGARYRLWLYIDVDKDGEPTRDVDWVYWDWPHIITTESAGMFENSLISPIVYAGGGPPAQPPYHYVTLITNYPDDYIICPLSPPWLRLGD